MQTASSVISPRITRVAISRNIRTVPPDEHWQLGRKLSFSPYFGGEGGAVAPVEGQDLVPAYFVPGSEQGPAPHLSLFPQRQGASGDILSP